MQQLELQDFAALIECMLLPLLLLTHHEIVDRVLLRLAGRFARAAVGNLDRAAELRGRLLGGVAAPVVGLRAATLERVQQPEPVPCAESTP